MRLITAITYIALFMLSSVLFSQYKIEGSIKNKEHIPIAECSIQLENNYYKTNSKGLFTIPFLKKGEYLLKINHLDYIPFQILVKINSDQILPIVLEREITALEEVKIVSNSTRLKTVNSRKVNHEYILNNLSSSFAQSLEKLPGLSTNNIGASTSKPSIRGLGANQIMLTENGIKQEGQQWGAEHGLEIDAFGVEEVEIIKGAAGIEYGSDAIGGVIAIKNNLIPKKNTTSGEWITLAKSNNQNLTTAFHLKHRNDKFFYKIKGSYSDYGDYSIPTNHISYLGQEIPIYNKRVKNTAGNEQNLSAQIGYVDDYFQSLLSFSNTYQKHGFFPAVHGIPSLDKIQDDGDRRNIEYPRQNTNHSKIISENTFTVNRKDKLSFTLGFQNNHRQEWNLFHTHFEDDEHNITPSNLEFDFNLSTYSTDIKFEHYHSNRRNTSIGFQSQNQVNRIKGFGFLLPNYKRNQLSAYILHMYRINQKLNISAGIRYDYSNLKTERFFDKSLYEYLLSKGETESSSYGNAEKSKALNKNYNNLNGKLSLAYNPNKSWIFDFNLGSSFRLPTAMELASNGIHHGSFRHEKGDANLDSEKGFSVDISSEFNQKNWSIELNPFLYYFSNYIYLRPTGVFSKLPDAGQIYQYDQTKAIISGFELSLKYRLFERLETLTVLEYLYNTQITKDKSKRYPLPMTPANNAFIELDYLLLKNKGFIQRLNIFANSKLALKQDRIAQNEEKTKGYILFGGGVKANVSINNFSAELVLQTSNIFNKEYLNHTSFYRKFQLSEQGRNIQLMLRIPFS